MVPHSHSHSHKQEAPFPKQTTNTSGCSSSSSSRTKLPMAPSRLQNFSLPPLWGNNKQRCRKPTSPPVAVDHPNPSSQAHNKSLPPLGSHDVPPQPKPSHQPSRSILFLRIPNRRLTDEQPPPPTKNESPPSVAAATNEEELINFVDKPWNLRPRKQPLPLSPPPPPVKQQDNKKRKKYNTNNNYREVLEDNHPKSLRLRPSLEPTAASPHNVGKKKVHKIFNFSLSLSRQEIEDDFFVITGSKPPRRPKRRPKYAQKQIDGVSPGLWLSEITPDLYNVAEPTTKNR